MPAVMGSNIPDQGVTSRMLNLTAITADVTANETTTSTTYTDLATSGPANTVSSGVTQDHLITISAQGKPANSGFAYINVAVAAAAPSSGDATEALVGTSGAAANYALASRSVLASAVATGAVHTMKYRVSTGTGEFAQRRVITVAL